MADKPFVAHVARRICQEQCAFMGEPACWMIDNPVEPRENPHCQEPGCFALATAALAAMRAIMADAAP